MSNKFLDTSKRMKHVFLCDGQRHHIWPGTEIARIGEMKCPTCGAEVKDVTNEPIGQSYFAFVRTDLGVKQ